MLQPLGLGIIKNFKCHYRTHQVRAILSKLESSSDASEVAKSINVLNACYWIRGAMDDIKPVTVECCFRKAGVKHEQEAAIVTVNADETTELTELVPTLAGRLELSDPLIAEMYMRVDSEVPGTEELHIGWEQELVHDFVEEKTDGNDSEDDEQIKLEPKPLITMYLDAMKWAKEIKMFAAVKGLDTVLQDIISVKDKLQVTFLSKSKHQTQINSYFKPM